MAWEWQQDINIEHPSLESDEFYLDSATTKQRAIVIDSYNQVIKKNNQDLSEGFKELFVLQQEREDRRKARKAKKSKKSRKRKKPDDE